MAFINVRTSELRATAGRLRTIQSDLDELGLEARARLDDLGLALSDVALGSLIEQFRQSSRVAPEALDQIARFLENVAQQLEETDSSLAQGLG